MPTLVSNTSMTLLPVLEWDSSFHGSVHTATLTVCTVLTIFVLILGTFGNGLVLLSALQCHKLRSNFDILVFNLAGADFIVCCCLSPTFLYLLFAQPPSPREFCGGFLFTSSACGLLSLLTLVAIAAHRQSRVRGRLKGSLSSRRTACVLVVIYIISIGTALAGTLHVTLSWIESYTTCQAVMNSNDITTNNVVLFFLSPVIMVSFAVIVISYCIIARSVRVQTYLRVLSLQRLVKPTVCASTDNPYFDFQKIIVENSKNSGNKETLVHCTCCSCMIASDKENKAVTMCFVVIVIVALCWTPLVISHCIELITGESIILYQVKLCGIALVFLNSALDPYMYAQNSARIKKTYSRFFSNVFPCGFRVRNQSKCTTWKPKDQVSRTLGKPTLNADCLTIHCVQQKLSPTIVQNDNSNVVTKVQLKGISRTTYHRNVMLYGEDKLCPLITSPKTKTQEVNKRLQTQEENKRPLTQTSRINEVRSLVHKSCCHGNSPDNQSLIDS